MTVLIMQSINDRTQKIRGYKSIGFVKPQTTNQNPGIGDHTISMIHYCQLKPSLQPCAERPDLPGESSFRGTLICSFEAQNRKIFSCLRRVFALYMVSKSQFFARLQRVFALYRVTKSQQKNRAPTAHFRLVQSVKTHNFRSLLRRDGLLILCGDHFAPQARFFWILRPF